MVNSTPNDKTVSGSSFVNTLPPTWEQFIAKTPGISTLTILSLLNDYDPFNDTTQIDETDSFFEDEEDIAWIFETKSNFDFGWSCLC